ncbi:hypothetical protein [Aestuariispira ectoiniformans]|uniref:hypothetical protein n=1 Tax=Aestuariispira ectoiniformans TaxID=2775080 RepID=UPI00223B479F|nr:hypothetical protein [Aestuariispira ectoiniformans]
MHYRMIDALAEAHLMACTQKKGDIAQILLQAIEVEMEKYGRQRRERRANVDMLEIAKARQDKLATMH